MLLQQFFSVIACDCWRRDTISADRFTFQRHMSGWQVGNFAEKIHGDVTMLIGSFV